MSSAQVGQFDHGEGEFAENLNVFDFKLDDPDLAHIAKLETGASRFFSHRDPAMVKSMSERRLDV